MKQGRMLVWSTNKMLYECGQLECYLIRRKEWPITLGRKYNLNKGIKVSINLSIQRPNLMGMKNNEKHNRMNMLWSNYWEPLKVWHSEELGKKQEWQDKSDVLEE